MFDIITSRDFLAKLEADFADYAKEPGSGRLALNCAMTAYHMHEWVWGDWLKKDYGVWKALGIRDVETFLAWIDKACPWFWWVQNLTNGTKHFSRDLPFKPLRVSLLPSARNLPNAGADDSHWDGPMPYLTAGPDVLLIDNGPGAGEVHDRYMPVAMSRCSLKPL
ncbi:MAG TPA: hypothetical protein VJ376_13240 [Pseudomonadota bacterium]|nr:hypothetical protein [Pseudomonadota bacterium]